MCQFYGKINKTKGCFVKFFVFLVVTSVLCFLCTQREKVTTFSQVGVNGKVLLLYDIG